MLIGRAEYHGAPIAQSALAMRMRQRVLIVDDNSDIRRLYAIGLNQRGFEVKLAANGAEALERIVDEKPDIVLLDWLMPLMDGGELLDRIGGRNERLIPVIVISGQPAPQTLDPRIQAWLTKPVSVDELVTVLSAES
jgi:CheY-like chemotaxis protein